MAATGTREFPWLETLRNARKTSLVQDGKRKIHFTFADGTQMVEEYSVANGELLVRKWKKKTTLGKECKWEYEIGEEVQPVNIDSEHIMESRANPIFIRKDVNKAFQWRVRNLPYPLEVYSVTVDDDRKTITTRTNNKKYFKKFSIPDMVRAELPLDQSSISLAHANNTLIISYAKPPMILEQEKLIKVELAKTQGSKEGDIECKPS
ncbi:predicted protein [Nematostella vectensis]|uniref:Protein DPCD n=2 Tax=Nematostella vectensis TaxID=45351 RepID=A7S7K7_NEMVE|nr:predicted protein [Nematostella vectensis]|eukprot:XP_001632414.1 predicted protein [Nematostella vectensis]